MLYAGENKVVARLSSLVLLSLIISLSSQAFANNKLIIPEICLPRAVEIGIIPSAKDVHSLRSRLSNQNAGDQYYDFKKINEAYGQTLSAINKQIEDYRSPLFRYLEKCRNSEKTCHGYFQPTDHFHQQIFCDRQIFQSTLQVFISAKKIKFDQCVNEPFDQIEISKLQIHPDIKYTASCFSKIEIDGIDYLKNKTADFLKQIKNAFDWFASMNKLTKKSIDKSLVPEGTKFILEKTIEEFDDISLRESKIKDLNEYYNTRELATEFQHCCDKTELYNQDHQVSNSYLQGTGDYIEQNAIQPNTLVFRAQDVLSQLVFDEADRQYWRDIIKNQSPLELNQKQKYEYFAYLKKDPFFYADSNRTFGGFVQEAKQHKRSDYYYRLPNDAEWETYMDTYQKKMDYTAPKMVQPQKTVTTRFGKQTIYTGVSYPYYFPERVDLKNPKQVINHYLFDYGFSQAYMDHLTEENASVEKKKFDALKEKTYYPEIFHGFLHYQFARTTQAQIVREIQKRPREVVDGIILKDVENFHRWADAITCKYNTLNTYCTKSQEPFRKKKHAQLYEKIISGKIELDYAPTGTKRQYIYNKAFVDDLNRKIKNINQLCWENADTKSFTNNRKSFEEPLKKLNEKMEDFYTTPRFEEILGHSDFADVFAFKPSEYATKCFTKGYLFGASGFLSAKGVSLTSQVSGYAAMGTVPVYNYVNLDDYPVKEVYIPSLYQISKEDIEDIEDDIEDKINDEYLTLRKAFFYKDFDEYESFLQESATVRIFALIDYAVDHPSQQVGKYICNMIQESDLSEYEKMRTREFITNLAMSGAIVVSIFALPIGGVAAIMIDSGVALVATGVAVGTAVYEIQYYKHRNDMVDLSLITGNKQPKDAMNLHEFNDQNISQAEMSVMIDLGLFLIVGARPVFKASKIVQKMLDKEYNLIRKTRQMELEELIGQTAGQVEKVNLSPKVEDFIYDYKKVSDADFKLYKNALLSGKGDDFIRTTWKGLEKYVPVKTEPTKTWRESWNETLTKVANTPALRVPYEWADSKYSVFIKPSWLRLKPYINQYILNPFGTELSNETRVVSFLTRAKELEKRTGRAVFTEEEYAAFAQRLKLYALDDSGNFYKITEKELLQALDRLMLSSVTGNPYPIRAWLEPLVKGELLNADEWSVVLKTFKGKITSIDDCKSFLKVIKFAKREYAGMRAQLENARELANIKEFRRPSVYQIRTNKILENINEFYDVAKYTRNKNDIRTIRTLGEYLSRSGKTVKQLEEEIRKFDHDFELQSKIDNLDGITDEINRFEFKRSDILQRLEGDEINIASMDKWKDPFKYEKQFLQQERKYNDIFSKKLSKYFQREKNISLAYGQALIKTQLQKKAEYECSLPSSAVRLASDRSYQRLAKQIAVGTNFMGYWANHGDEQKSPEWMGRFLYDMSVGYFGGNIQSKVFTTRGGGPMYKTFYDLLSGDIISAFDAFIYSRLGKSSWNTREKYQSQFAKIIYESEDTDKTIREFFAKNPEVEAKIMERFKKIHDVFDQAELKNAKGTMVNSDMEDLFIKAGLIDDIVYNDMEIKDRELGKSYVYHELLENGYVDPDLYKTDVADKDLQDQLYALLAEIRYEDLFDHKSGQIKYPLIDPITQVKLPFMDPVSISDFDAIEIQSGDEGVDRFLFYAGYDLGKTVVAYPKNNLVYKILCNGRFLPGNTNVALALAVHLAYKATMDPLKYYLREQATGH